MEIIKEFINRIDLSKSNGYNKINKSLIKYNQKYEEYIEKHKHIFRELKDILNEIKEKEYYDYIKLNKNDELLIKNIENIDDSDSVRNNALEDYEKMKDEILKLSHSLDKIWSDYKQIKSELTDFIKQYKDKIGSANDFDVIEYENKMKNEKINRELVSDLKNFKKVLNFRLQDEIKRKKYKKESLIITINSLLDKNPNYNKYKLVRDYCNDKDSTEMSILEEYKADIDVYINLYINY